jgi:uncharacterized membrane protein YccC
MATDDLVGLGAFAFTGLAMLFLAICKRYDAGIVGLAGTALTCFAAVAMVTEAWEGYVYRFPREVVGFAVGVAIFFGWYLFRFLRKQRRLDRARARDEA